jgi:hypothetical protein
MNTQLLADQVNEGAALSSFCSQRGTGTSQTHGDDDAHDEIKLEALRIL